MIFQVPIKLEIQNRNVQAIIDLDTGFIGFTESVGEQTKEYYYSESSVELRKALINKLEPFFAERSFGNFKICRKAETMKKISKIFTESK